MSAGGNERQQDSASDARADRRARSTPVTPRARWSYERILEGRRERGRRIRDLDHQREVAVTLATIGDLKLRSGDLAEGAPPPYEGFVIGKA